MQLRNLSHGLDPDDALDGEVRLISERARKVVCAELIRRDQRVRDQELSPPVQQVEL